MQCINYQISTIVDNERRMFTVVGYASPISNVDVNYFGVKFMEVARMLNINLTIQNFDSYVVKIQKESLNKFKKQLHKVFETVQEEK